MNTQFDRNRWKPVTFFLVTWLVFLAGFPGVTHAQMETTTGINGTVTDSTGAVVVGADVSIREQNTGAIFHTKTSAVGVYNFPAVLPGVYTITVTYPGFQKAVVTDRKVLATQPGTVDISLTVGQAAQTVTISASGAELLNTADQTITGTITPTLVQNLPTVRGNFFDLLTLAPGVTPQTPGAYTGGLGLSQTLSAYNYVNVGNAYNASGAFVGGNRDSASNVSVDGSNVQDPVYQNTPQSQPMDTVQELRVQTANMNAEFGYGASGISVITKSGTNRFHGDVFEYLRNNDFDAQNFIANISKQTLPHYEQNLFGGSIGGPILKNKLMFFFNYQGLRALQIANAQANVVPNNYRNGDFSFNPNTVGGAPAPTIPIYNPYQYNPTTGLRQQFPNNMIPLGPTNLCAPKPQCVDPATVAFLKQYMLAPNATAISGSGAGAVGQPIFLGSSPSDISSNDYTARVDFLHSERSTIYGRYTQTPSYQVAGSYDPLVGTVNNFASYNAVAHWIESISPNTVNHFFVGYTRPKWFYGRKTNVPDVSKQIGIQNTSSLPGGPDFVMQYDSDVSGVFILPGVSNAYQAQDDLSTVHGRHTIKFGVSLIDKRFSYNGVSDDKGVFVFTGAYTSACPPTNTACLAGLPSGFNNSTTGLDFADFLLGATSLGTYPYSNYVQLNPAPYDGHQLYSGFYVQDSWRATNKLTVNVGLRYEHWTPWLVPRNTTLSYDPTTGNPVYALQNPLDYLDPTKCGGKCAPLNPAAVNRASYKTGNLDFAPRFGLAYQLLPNTVLRASFGIYFDNNRNDNQLSNIQTGAAPFTYTYSQPVIVNETPVPTYTVSTMFPIPSAAALSIATPSPTTTYRFVQKYLPDPSVNQWSFDMEQRLGKTWGLDVSYVGSHTSHEFQFIDVNAAQLPTPGTAAASIPLQQRRLYPNWGNFGSWLPIGWGSYNGLVASFHNANPWHGLTVISNFQWSKNIVSSHWGYSDIGETDFRNPYIYKGDYSTAQPGRLVFGYNYNTPIGRGKQFGSNMNPVLDKVIGGWVLSGITTFAKGNWAPMFDLGPDLTGNGEKSTANRVCNPMNVPGGQTYIHWFNASCFARAQPGVYGNSNLDAIEEPGRNNFDIALQKTFKTGFPKDSGEFQIRWDTFNSFNHTQFGYATPYISNWSSTTIGKIGTTYPARQMQFTAKYTF